MDEIGSPTLMTGEQAWRRLLALGRSRDSEPGAMGRRAATAPSTAEARQLLDLYLPLVARRDLVIAQLGQSVDGKIATVTGHSHYINGPDDIRRLHRLRALVDAVIVGAGTVESDDPRLTVREVPGEHPVRVLLDPSGRVSPTARVLSDGIAPTLWLQSAPPPGSTSAGPETRHEPRAPRAHESRREFGSGRKLETGRVQPGVEVIRLDERAEGGFDPAEVVSLLASRGLRRILVEGGGTTVSRFLASGVLDRLHVSVAPLILGSGRPGLTLPLVDTLDQALRPPVRHFHLGDDLLFDFDLASG